jgi:hypothetical protein
LNGWKARWQIRYAAPEGSARPGGDARGSIKPEWLWAI